LPTLRSAAERADGLLAPCYLAHVEALVARSAEGLDDVSLRFEELGLTQLALESAATAVRLYRGQGATRSAAATARRAGRLAAATEVGTGPWLLDLRASVPLTRRESEVATLAATGSSDRVIATSLGLSTRTVQTHLARVYAKLGVHSRHELDAALDG
jgi:DNA-binding NarL/FixJ family response regulator